MRLSGNDAGHPQQMDQALQRLFSLSAHNWIRTGVCAHSWGLEGFPAVPVLGGMGLAQCSQKGHAGQTLPRYLSSLCIFGRVGSGRWQGHLICSRPVPQHPSWSVHWRVILSKDPQNHSGPVFRTQRRMNGGWKYCGRGGLWLGFWDASGHPILPP